MAKANQSWIKPAVSWRFRSLSLSFRRKTLEPLLVRAVFDAYLSLYRETVTKRGRSGC